MSSGMWIGSVVHIHQKSSKVRFSRKLGSLQGTLRDETAALEMEMGTKSFLTERQPFHADISSKRRLRMRKVLQFCKMQSPPVERLRLPLKQTVFSEDLGP
jgi:hypothetical protein